MPTPRATTATPRPVKRTAKRSGDVPPNVQGREVKLEDSPFVGDPGTADAIAFDEATPDFKKSKPETELIIASLLKTYVMMGQAVTLVSFADGIVIAQNAETLSESWRSLLDDDPKLRKIMLKLVRSSGWGTVITAHLTVALPIVINHRDGLSHLVRPKNANTDSTYNA